MTKGICTSGFVQARNKPDFSVLNAFLLVRFELWPHVCRTKNVGNLICLAATNQNIFLYEPIIMQVSPPKDGQIEVERTRANLIHTSSPLCFDVGQFMICQDCCKPRPSQITMSQASKNFRRVNFSCGLAKSTNQIKVSPVEGLRVERNSLRERNSGIQGMSSHTTQIEVRFSTQLELEDLRPQQFCRLQWPRS